MKTLRWLLLLLVLCGTISGSAFAAEVAGHGDSLGKANFPRPEASYEDAGQALGTRLVNRAKSDPVNAVATAIFIAAIIHTFMSSKFMGIAHHYEHKYNGMEEYEGKMGNDPKFAAKRDKLQFQAQMFHFLGEVEVVFGIWLIPLFVAISTMKGWNTMVHYVNDTSFAEPVFVTVIMAIAASRPVLALAEASLAKVAAIGNSTTAAWWLAILTVGPILGSLITEPAAMTICALVLGERFYSLHPSPTLKYATLGLLFVNISVGGTLSHFAAPPVVMVAAKWGWGFAHMIEHFGWKSVVGIIIANSVYFIRFRTELIGLTAGKSVKAAERPIPFTVTLVHLLFIGWTVLTAHYPTFVVLGFLFFLAFTEATARHQSPLQLRSPMLVGFFLASLVIHGGGQEWWISPVLGSLTRWPLMIGATVLTAFNDNAAITYLATLVPGFSDSLKFAVVAGAVAGGGLTVVANAPNPAGQSILQKYFGAEGISPAKLFLAALLPTIIMGAALMLL